ncbi:unnamed protein product [Diatraea saccharalis]|uniref:FAD-binding PCMH-type domain-containing protein n=1 Tax=Diatraea saccharalis TaxID=40085 RepID=A0A9N9R2C5_9NEOP|nr:unnamed protein product [Diatraea saccharalis]
MAEMERAFGCNTCRCTGFRPIMDTVKSFAVDASADLCQKVRDIEELNICKKTNAACERKCSVKSVDSDWSILTDDSIKYDSQDTIVLDTDDNHKYFKVYNEDEIFNTLRLNGTDSYMFIDGNTGKGLYDDFDYPRVLIDISSVKSLKTYKFDQNLILGANISLQDCITIFKDAAATRSEFAYLAEFAKHLDLIAHIPVRNIGSIAGNLMLRDGLGSHKLLKMTEFLKYDMCGRLVVSVELPPLSSKYVVQSYKVMPRHQNSLAIVNACFVVKVNSKTNVIDDAKLVFGNISADFIHATKTEVYLKGKNFLKDDTVQGAINLLNNEIQPKDIPPQQSPECRKKLAIGLFYKFMLKIASSNAAPRYRSGGNLISRPVSKGHQDYQTDKSLYPLNQPVHKLEAKIQSAGEAQFANDIPPMPHEVFGAFALSTVASGKVDTVKTEKVLKIEGVVAVYTAKDIPGKNSFTKPGIQLQMEDEEILATDIKFCGQPVAIVVATTEELAAKVAKQLEITYKDVRGTPPVLTIDQAKKDSKRYSPYSDGIEPKSKGNNVKKIIKGVYQIDAQYHYYMEPITSVVVPVDERFEVYDSCQWMDLTQIAVAQCLGIKESDVVVKVLRVGGGFGGKISRNVQAVGIDDDGKIQYLNATIVEDDGCSHNENILAYVAQGFPNCYDPSTFSLKTAAVLTDLPSNSFARAPGTAEGISSIEHIMEHIAFTVKKDATEVRKLNMRTEDNDLPPLIDDFKKETDYDKRAKEIDQFNKSNRWMKKAICISVMSFPVIYYGNYSGMVSVYRGDGTVTVTTGGIEMGQGCNTKVAQVCAYVLGIPVEYVSVLPHHSFTAANNVFSGSSITSESTCYAVMKACKMINQRLEPIRAKMTDPTWKALVMKAGDEEVDLTAIYMMTDKEEDLSGYNAYAVTILEAQLDILTGQFELLRVDILEDVGLSANPNLDVGQVEGGYIQGLGYFMCEKLVYDKKTGKLLTNRSINYHVPLALDIPAEFNVKLRYNSKNPKGVLGSKAVPYDTEAILGAVEVKLNEMVLTK